MSFNTTPSNQADTEVGSDTQTEHSSGYLSGHGHLPTGSRYYNLLSRLLSHAAFLFFLVLTLFKTTLLSYLIHFLSIVSSCVFHIISVAASADSTAQTAQPSGVDWQEEVYQKVLCYISYNLYFLTEVLQRQQKLVKQILSKIKIYMLVFILRILHNKSMNSFGLRGKFMKSFQ